MSASIDGENRAPPQDLLSGSGAAGLATSFDSSLGLPRHYSDRDLLYATTCGLVAGQLMRNHRRRQAVDPVGVAVGAGVSAHPARDVATWLAREIGIAARREVYLLAAFGTGLTLAYLTGASRGLAKGKPRFIDPTN